MHRHTACAALALLLAGCAGQASGPGAETSRSDRGRPAGEPREIDSDLLAQIQRSAEDLRALQEGSPPEPPTASAGEPFVGMARPAQSNVGPVVEVDPPAAEPEADTKAPAIAAAPEAPVREAEIEPARETAGELARRLASSLRADPDADPVRVYAALAALEVIEPGLMVNPSAIEGLTPEDARILESWADLMREADARLVSSPADARALSGALADAASAAETFEPLEIGVARLCSRVEGFGRYTPMGSTWLAGRPHRAVVYAEVDHFASSPAVGPTGARGFETRLTQELQLFHDSDGLLAWRLPPQDVRDFSRNRRRDFFVVQLIELPQSLTVGRYQLKVTLRDETSGQTAETVLPITIVADEGLIGPTPE
jgi:hypothetical protein